MQNQTTQVPDLARGQSFLADSGAIETYRMQHGSRSLMPVMGDGGQFLVKHCDDERVNLISYCDFSEKVVSRDVFDKGYFVVFQDEMPLYLSPSPEFIDDFNKDVEAYAKAASLCA